MRLLHLSELTVELPGRTLLDHVNWSIFRGERYGLVGPNGAGKTTILRLIAGQNEPSSGTIQRSRDLTVGYLPQDGVAHKGRSLFEEAWSGLPDLPHLQVEITALREEIAASPDNLELIEELGVLEHRWEDLEGYHAEAKVARVLGGLGFREEDFTRQIEEFSGGWQMRIALAKLLLFDPDLLLLDEPTNHLDLPALVWLEDYLRRFSGSLIIVSHDRSFLDRVVGRIASLERSELIVYLGDYSTFEKARAERQEQLEARAEKVEGEREKLEAFIDRFRYKASKARQVQSRVKMLEKLEDVEVTPANTKRVHFRFPAAPSSGRVVLDIKAVTKNYGNRNVFHDAGVVLSRGEKVALVGVNGAGKSTLCRLIVGVDQPTTGEIKLGHNVTVDYFAQEADFHLDSSLTVLEQLEAESGSAPQSGLRSLLGAFLFSGDDVYKRVSVLSGGEKSRLALAKMLLHPSNFIILDEPTNHLDMASQNVLLDALNAYEGTLLVVSHDRYFLDRLVNRVLEIEGGTLRDWPGNLSEYLSRKGLTDASSAQKDNKSERIPFATGTDAKFKSKEQKRAEAEIRNRLSSAFRAVRDDVNGLQTRIDKHEARKLQIEKLLADEELYRDPDKCRTLMSEYEQIRKELPALLTQWEEAAVRLEELERQKLDELKSQPGANPA
ncbi:MAG TPA: ABC-F family ATP-binding cassette domain-containing protein [bacterium]|jgi:ATP-binding cassette subfamily F protein 3